MKPMTLEAPHDGRCLPDDVLESLASESVRGSRSDDSEMLWSHVDRCDSCRGRFARIRADNGLLDEFRGAVGFVTRPVTHAVGDRIDAYQLAEEIGRGGQGVVFRALDTRTGRPVALKLLRSDSLTSVHRRRFDREIDIIARLRHPGIVTLYEALEIADGGRAIVMELVNGSRLDTRAAQARETGGPLATPLLDLLIGICDAVQHAHLNGVIHRDLKPGNVLVDSDGRPRVLDFGIAKLDSGDGSLDETAMTTGFVGSPMFAAPEQILGDGAPTDARADIFALGGIAYQAMSGQYAFPARGDRSKLSDIVRAEGSPAPLSVAAHLQRGARSRDLDAVINKALAHEPERRYQSVAELRADLAALREGAPVSARPDGLSYLLRRAIRRHRVAVLVASAAVVALVATAATALALWRSAEDRARFGVSTEIVSAFLGTLPPDPSIKESLSEADRAMVLGTSDRMEQLIASLGDDEQREATVRYGWAHLLFNGLGDARAALPHAKRSLALREKLNGASDPSTLNALEMVAIVHNRLGELPEAKLAAQQLSERTKAAFPQGSRERLRVESLAKVIDFGDEADVRRDQAIMAKELFEADDQAAALEAIRKLKERQRADQ